MSEIKAPTKGSDIAWDVAKNELIKTIREKNDHNSFTGALGETDTYFDKNEARIDVLIDKLNNKKCKTRSEEIAIMLEESTSLADFVIIHGIVVLSRAKTQLQKKLMIDALASMITGK